MNTATLSPYMHSLQFDTPGWHVLRAWEVTPEMSYTIINSSNNNTTIESLFDQLTSGSIEIQDRGEIATFLNQHEGLIDILLTLPIILSNSFPTNSKFILRPTYDELEDGDVSLSHLLIVIQTTLAIPEATEALGNLRRNWLIPNMNSDVAYFSAVLEFVHAL